MAMSSRMKLNEYKEMRSIVLSHIGNPIELHSLKLNKAISLLLNN